MGSISNKVEILNSFKEEIETRGTISKADVLSLESMLDEPIITNSLDLKRFPEERMRMNVKETVNIITKTVDQIAKPISNYDILMDIKQLKLALSNYISNLELIKIHNKNLLTILSSPEIKYKYFDDVELRDLDNEPFLDLVKRDGGWREHLVDLVTKDIDMKHVIESQLAGKPVIPTFDPENDANKPATSYSFAPTMSVLLQDKCNDYTGEILTVKRVRDFITSASVYAEKMKSLRDVIDEDIRKAEQGESIPWAQRDNWDTVYSPLCKYILQDEASREILHALTTLASAYKAGDGDKTELDPEDDIADE